MNNVYQYVTRQCIANYSKKIQRKTRGQKAINYITRKYRGINLCLPYPGEYLTFKQVQNVGGCVKKVKIPYVGILQLVFKGEEDGEVKTVNIPVLRYYNVFHISQCEGISQVRYIQNRKRKRHNNRGGK